MEWGGQFSKQVFSKWHIRTLANVAPKAEPLATPSLGL